MCTVPKMLSLIWSKTALAWNPTNSSKSLPMNFFPPSKHSERKLDSGRWNSLCWGPHRALSWSRGKACFVWSASRASHFVRTPISENSDRGSALWLGTFFNTKPRDGWPLRPLQSERDQPESRNREVLSGLRQLLLCSESTNLCLAERILVPDPYLRHWWINLGNPGRGWEHQLHLSLCHFDHLCTNHWWQQSLRCCKMITFFFCIFVFFFVFFLISINWWHK